MSHLTEADLVLYRYQESPDPDTVARHLAACARCRAEYASLERVFAAVEAPAPEPGPAYEREVWARIQDRLAAEPPRTLPVSWAPVSRWIWPQVALAATITLLLIGSVWMQQTTGSHGTTAIAATAGSEPQVPQDAASIRNRVVLSAVGDHLQRAEMMLTEFNNTDSHRAIVDLTDEQAWAEDLVSENRLYRRSAADANAGQIVGLLDELERVLLEVAHAPTETTPEQLDRLRMRLGTQDVLFKVRVASAGMRERQQAFAAAPETPDARHLSGS